ncbi:MAG TPA: flagellar basal body-associated FliL family protein [Stellaceae bacterium]|nr:flagellar basal body-associated FliL family protein [Stellaceae bacterium]
MTDQTVDLDVEAPKSGKGRIKLYIIIAVAVVLLGAGAGAAWYFLLGGAHAPKEVEAPLPVFLDLKPFVVTVPSRSGPSHFVQLGVSFQVSGSAASALVDAVLPKIKDAMRQTLLTFKSEDMQSPETLDKVRVALLAQVNRALVAELGQERIDKANGGKPGQPLVRSVYFPTLIVE